MQPCQGRGEVIGHPGLSGTKRRSTLGSDMMPFQGISPKVYLHINAGKEQSKLAHSKEPAMFGKGELKAELGESDFQVRS